MVTAILIAACLVIALIVALSANEITATAGLTGTKNGLTVNQNTSHTFTLTGSQMSSGVQTIGTSNEQIVFGVDLIAEGISYMALKNLDSTNYVDIFLDNADAEHMARIKAGGVAIIPVYDQTPTGGPDYYAKANTAACNLLVTVVGIT